MVPLGLGEPNQIDEPYGVQKVTFGWAAGDAAYAMGSFDLAPDEALVITRPLTGVRVLELLPVEPVHAHVQLRLRERHDQRRADAVRGRWLVDDSSSPRRTRATELAVDRRATRAVGSGSAGSTRRRRPTARTTEVVKVASLRP